MDPIDRGGDLISLEPRVLVSACLLGIRCRWDGSEAESPSLAAVSYLFRFVPVCPGQLGDLPTPRKAAESIPRSAE
ncbi:2-thiouracil desulfurase family protein [Thermanaerovibrio acidaminovorans]|uniref:2-thiouracil desulfurase family protein n=1 Tax=Thermanaerovibrio acidaminovorans TaxID=81462 RepID=UPI003A520E33